MINKKINFLLSCLLFMFSTLTYAEATISFNEQRVISAEGNEFSVDILMSEFPNTEGGGLVIYFNPDLLEVVNLSVDADTWSFVNKDGNINNAAGVVSDVLFSSYNGVSGDAKVATVIFKSIGKGKGQISLGESASNPFASNGAKIAVTYDSMDVRVSRDRRK